jgi:hypothetical protein
MGQRVAEMNVLLNTINLIDLIQLTDAKLGASIHPKS